MALGDLWNDFHQLHHHTHLRFHQQMHLQIRYVSACLSVSRKNKLILLKMTYVPVIWRKAAWG